jgi:uncharacterized protein (TIGR02569 family)
VGEAITEVPRHVLEAFGIRGSVRPLPGGQGTSWQADWLVLKPHADEAEIDWLVGLCGRSSFDGVRVPEPVVASHGRFVVDGWYATTFTPGEPVGDNDRDPTAWLPVLAAGRAFHAAVCKEPPPPFLHRRSHRWAAADLIAWDRAAPLLPEQVASRLQLLQGLTWEEGLPPQLVHGDLSGNVLLSPDHVPAVIDISPYWRPPAYAQAIVVIDALLWWRTDLTLVDLAQPDAMPARMWWSLLSRAAIFRLLASSVAFDISSPDHASELQRFDSIIGRLTDHC